MTNNIDLPPDEPILDRVQVPKRIAEALSEPLSYLEILADEGVRLLKRSFFSSKREVPDVVLLPVLFRQVLAFLDAVHLHLPNGAVYSAAPDVRSMFEAWLALEWIIQGPPARVEPIAEWRGRWARQYYVSELRKERDWTRSFVPRTPDHAKLKKAAPQLAAKLAGDPEKVDAARKRLREIGKHLSNIRSFREINSRFGTLKKKLRGKEPSWYRVGGPSTIGDLAQRLGKSREYQILYKHWSEVAHGARTAPHVRITGKELVVEAIRSFDGLDQILKLACSIAEGAIYMILSEYRPGEIEQFVKKREGEWKAKRTIPEIVINTHFLGHV